MRDIERGAIESDYQERIRRYLGYRALDQRVQDELTQWSEIRTTEGIFPSSLLQQSESLLRWWQVVLPGSSTLEHLVASAAAQAQQRVFVRIAERLAPALCQDIDDVLKVALGDHRSVLLRLKEYPPEASAAVMLAHVTRYPQVHDLVSFYPRYFCYYERAITLYTHTSEFTKYRDIDAAPEEWTETLRRDFRTTR